MKNSVILEVDESTQGLMREIQSGISESIEEGLREVKGQVGKVDGSTEMIARKLSCFDGFNSSVEDLRKLADESRRFAEVATPLQSSIEGLTQATLKGEKKQDEVLFMQQEVKATLDNIALLQDSIQAEIKAGQAAIATNLTAVFEESGRRFGDILSSIEQLAGVQKEQQAQLMEQFRQLMTTLESVVADMKSWQTRSAEDVRKLDVALQNLHKKADAQEQVTQRLLEQLTAQEEAHHAEVQELLLRMDKAEQNREAMAQRIMERCDSQDAALSESERKTESRLLEQGELLQKLQATADIIINLVTPFWKRKN